MKKKEREEKRGEKQANSQLAQIEFLIWCPNCRISILATI